jgi:hypothetical protein
VTGGLIRTGLCSAATFTLMEGNWSVLIRETSGGTVTLTGPGAATMPVTDITFNTSDMSAISGGSGWNLGRYLIDTPSGIADFRLGGTLHVAADQTPGVYDGTIVVEVQFD